MPVHHLKGQPAASTYVREKGGKNFHQWENNKNDGGYYGLQTASGVRPDLRFEIYCPNYICNQVCLDCFGPFVNFDGKEKKTNFGTKNACDKVGFMTRIFNLCHEFLYCRTLFGL